MTHAGLIAGKILVTGAGGFVGRKLLGRLAQIADPAAAHLAITSTTLPPELKSNANWRAHSCDITNKTDVAELIRAHRPDVIVHLAAQSSVGAAQAGGQADTWDVNVVGSFNIADAIRRHAPNALVLFTSTIEVYGASFLQGVMSEDSPLLPQNAYGRSKAAAEALLADVLPESSKLITVRPANHSGPTQDQRFVIPSFARQIAQIEAGLIPPVVKVGNLEAHRDFLHVDDVMSAELDLIARANDLPSRSTFNISSGVPVSIENILKTLLELSPTAITIEQDPERMRPSDIPQTKASSRALYKATGWKPSIPLTALLADVLDYQRNQVKATNA